MCVLLFTETMANTNTAYSRVFTSMRNRSRYTTEIHEKNNTNTTHDHTPPHEGTPRSLNNNRRLRDDGVRTTSTSTPGWVAKKAERGAIYMYIYIRTAGRTLLPRCNLCGHLATRRALRRRPCSATSALRSVCVCVV